MRSFLFVPGDSERKLNKSLTSGADAIILDLEDSVAEDQKDEARRCVSSFLKENFPNPEAPKVFVRVNGVATTDIASDLEAVVGAAPFGILLPKARGVDDVIQLDNKLGVAEAAAGLEKCTIVVGVMVTETPHSLLNMQSYLKVPARVTGFAWGGEDLAASLGARDNHDEDGNYTEPFRLARTLSLVTAAAAGVQAIDAVYTDFRDEDGLKREALAGARDGFTGKLAIHPAQVGVINDAFTPSDDAIAEAQEIVAAFEADKGIGVVGYKDKMLDLPNLIIARNTLSRARLAGKL